ncbi:MAG: protease modulator HflK, partial [Betaproteobacteria bacterium]
MNSMIPSTGWRRAGTRMRSMFNLNDSRWGRSDEQGSDGEKPQESGQNDPPEPPAPPPPGRSRGQG